MKDRFLDAMREPPAQHGAGVRAAHTPWDTAALAVILIIGVVGAATLRDYGISNDEEVQHRYGELIVAYYTSGFTDRALFDYSNLYLYGGLFDVVAVLLAKLLPVDIYLLRHALCLLAGLGGIAAVWVAARFIAGPRAGFLAALALATTAQWYGPMFNHTKDIPFAAAMMGATYFLLRAAYDLPRPRWRDTLGFGLLFGAAAGLRAMGLLLIGYAGLVVLVALIAKWKEDRAGAPKFLAQAIWRFVPGFALGYALMLAAWPWAAQDIFNPIRAILAFAHFHYQIRTIAAGVVYEMADVPWWYVSLHLLIRLPLLLLVGASLAALFAMMPKRSATGAPPERSAIALLWFTVLFPVAAQAIGHGPAFTGMRHFMFVVPPLAVLAGVGLDASLARLAARRRMLAAAAGAAMAGIFLWETGTLVALHPHQYLYYNALVGGLPGAASNYGMDYWVNIMPEAVGRLRAYLDTQGIGPEQRVTVGVCGERFSFEHEADARMQWTAGWYEADFFIAPTHMGCDLATNGKVIALIERLGVPIGVVKDRRGYPSPAAKATR